LKTPSSTSQSSGSQPRRGGRRIVYYVLLLVGTVLIVDAFVGEKGLLATMQARAQHAALEQSLADVRADNARLREKARRLREDPDAIEDLARSELGLIRPGEKLFIVKDVGPRVPH
jgi:cell division protein FtsB